MALRRANQSGIQLLPLTVLNAELYYRYLKGELESTPVPLDDTFRVVNNESVDGTTLTNRAGKLDYVMVDKEAEVVSAWIDRNWDDVGKASDHWPVAAVVGL